MRRFRPASSPVHTALWVDAAFDLVAGLTLLLLHSRAASWLNVDGALVVVAAIVFLATAVGVVPIVLQREPARPVVTALAALNLIGGVAIWLVVALRWGDLTTEGHWLVAAIADSFIAVAALEFLALRRTEQAPRPTDGPCPTS